MRSPLPLRPQRAVVRRVAGIRVNTVTEAEAAAVVVRLLRAGHDVDVVRAESVLVLREAGEAGKAYEELMAKTGQVEIQLLGLGCNGHIGFNEPADEFTKVTGEIDLTDSTIEANKRFFEKKEDVPRKAVSMGIGTIMRAKKIVLLVNGENKAEILKEVVNGPVTPKVPGSILQFHPHVTVICDEEAAKYL